LTLCLIFDFLVKGFVVEGHGVVHHLSFHGLWDLSVVHIFGFLEHGVVHWVVHVDFVFSKGEFLGGEEFTVVDGWGDHLFSFEELVQEDVLVEEHVLSEEFVVHGWVHDFLFIDLEHTGWSVATNDFGVFLSHGENLVDHGVGVHIVGEDLVLSENLLSEDLVQVQFLEERTCSSTRTSS